MTSRQRYSGSAKAARRARAAELRRAAAETSADGEARGTHVGIGARGVGELSQVQQHRLGSEADDGDGGDVGETVARVATVTMKVA